MKRVIQVKNRTIGDGIPKICVPIVEETKDNIIKEATMIKDMPVDIVEWRVDWFEDSTDCNKVKDILVILSEILIDLPILFTFRTKREGGNKDIAVSDYIDLNEVAINTGLIDFIDVELFTGESEALSLIEYAHQHHCYVIASNHDFDRTPSKSEILKRLCKMQDLGADIPKIAVMPNHLSDVFTLLEATSEMKELHASGPIITMAMGSLGLISRLSGEFFGSSITFASANKKSAPGQMPVSEISTILELIHKNL
ncbi:type I 3-dehydroquinate dehydratase [Anaeromicropila herbilytica]|uniref:3-dehydroquinate dehydratase n=1 Tax=Anaeromicropila herbilytica TaxID=2785025 RepID=A0A7R7EKE4_9FIRM|nr:type I 3-dehydroquinate dehydratase [Anaeromicropila herbilytica]BCN30387.1 3-dehydroquinate dehydratase [Anaeromicropila herbilytica]